MVFPEPSKFRKSRVSNPVYFVAMRKSWGQSTTGDGDEHTVYTDAQSIITGQHPVYLLGRARGNIGGPFTSYRVEITSLGRERVLRANNNPSLGGWQDEIKTLPVAHGDIKNIHTVITNNQEPDDMASALTVYNPGPSKSNLTAMGAKAVDMVKPTNSTADVANSLAELLSERKFFSLPSKNSTVEGEYLNYMFGVAPTIGLAQDLRNAIENREAIVDQTIRDSGRLVRRRMEFDAVYNTTKTSGTGYCTTIGPPLNLRTSSLGTWTKIVSTKSRYWFSGAFTYYLPKEGIARDIALLDKLYGVRPGLDTPWELLPFSWLVDYKASAGSAISNMNSFAQEGLVMPYGYIMCQSEIETEYTWTGQLRNAGGSWENVSLYSRVKHTSKRRERANPFGFGILPGDLNAKQLSILAALGISLAR